MRLSPTAPNTPLLETRKVLVQRPNEWNCAGPAHWPLWRLTIVHVTAVGSWGDLKSWKRVIGKNGNLKDIGHGSYVMPTGFLDLDSRAPQTKSFKLTRSFRMWSGFSSVESFHRINHVVDSALILCDANPATSVGRGQILGCRTGCRQASRLGSERYFCLLCSSGLF